MVNINLNQEDEFKEQTFKDDSFAQTLNLESQEFSQERQEYSSDIPEFPKSSSNIKIYLIAGGLLIIAVLIFYLLYPGGDDSTGEFGTLSDPNRIEENLDASGADVTNEAEGQSVESLDNLPDAGAQEQELANTFDLSSLSPLEQELVASSFLGGVALDGISNAVSSNGAFTIIRFSGSAFLTEIVANSSAALQDIVENIQMNTGTPNLKIISQENTSMQGRSVVKALVSGDVSLDTAPGDINPGLRTASSDEFVSWLRSSARESQLNLTSLIEGAPAQSNGFDTRSILVNIQGNLANSLEYLTALQNNASNVLFEKISLINNDPAAASNNSVTLVMVLKYFRM